MRTINRFRFQTVTTDRSETGVEQVSARRPNPHLISEGVVASYLHDISQRHRRPDIAAKRSRRHAPAQRPPSVVC
jgi:hypothetical protein